MKNYQYQVIKYVHDHFTGEFVNLGIVVYDPETQYLNCKVSNRYKRINAMFPKAEGQKTIQTLNRFRKKLLIKKEELSSMFKPSILIDELTASVLPKDATVLQFSAGQTGLDVDLDAALHFLFKELVDKYAGDTNKSETLSDEDVWKQKYKQHFERAGIINKLSTHIIKTKNDKFEFDFAWKNEIWHCYEPISFELSSQDAIKDKVYRWAGKLQGIKQTDEKVSVTLLSSLSQENSKMKPFINEYLNNDDQNVEVEVVFNDKAEELVTKISKEMKEHDKNAH
jgi:hypothetical protein